MPVNICDLKRVDTFLKECPEIFDNREQLYHCWADREINGVERVGAIVKFRNRLMINVPRIAEWILNGERNAA